MTRLNRAADAVRRELGEEGRVLVRWSGTEAKLRIMIEGPREDQIHAWAKELAEAARGDAAAGD
jgi:phosphoglucosamine mutase